ncbi:unnamed protein product [Caenorhabditis bovis]|uniref:Uncharacterized protein n=1 Tax=Caenorhabditis bovis TaxID=2654633 RepID=A0A8S1EGX8_9PELO|nr:unnamed protein product [Caenorhabditis bovis]
MLVDVIRIVLFGAGIVAQAHISSLDKPIYEYLRDLCPVGQLPLTTPRAVRTCATVCPLGALCYRGICCVPQPQCRHPAMRVSAGFACLPDVKNNCPAGSVCTSSNLDGMSVCSFGDSHPVIAHDGKHLILCKDCHQGICAEFRSSNVQVCCQNSDDICGAGSTVLMDSLVPRDCSKKPCEKGYECSLTPTGLRVCCSLATCPSGVHARSVCAAGCLPSEKCVPIQNEMWCCPLLAEAKSRDYKCLNGEVSTLQCSPAFDLCPIGKTCQLNYEETKHICCSPKKEKVKKGSRPVPTTTIEPEENQILKCSDNSPALFQDGLSVMCSKLGEKCSKSGYTCQKSDIEDVFVCCFKPKPQISLASTPPPPPTPETNPSPTCPFSYTPALQETNGEVKRCLALFSLDCPFPYICLPSSTTDSYLCCIKKPFQ